MIFGLKLLITDYICIFFHSTANMQTYSGKKHANYIKCSCFVDVPLDSRKDNHRIHFHEVQAILLLYTETLKFRSKFDLISILNLNCNLS